MQFEVEPVLDRREQIDAQYQETVSDLHEIEDWTQNVRLIPIGRYSVCHGTGAEIPVRNSGPKILAQKF
jgi:RNA polymerase-binding transcription factor DksA